MAKPYPIKPDPRPRQRAQVFAVNANEGRPLDGCWVVVTMTALDLANLRAFITAVIDVVPTASVREGILPLLDDLSDIFGRDE